MRERYLLINYRQAELLLTTNGVERKLTLKAAREAFERYLSLLDHYEILSTAEKKLYNDYTEGPTAFSTMSSSDPAANRGAKIANFKLKKELEGQIEVLNGFKWSSRFILTDPQSLYSKSATNNVQRLSQDAAYLENDEDKVRELQLASLALCTHTTFQSLETINRELAVLAMAPAVPISRPDPSSLAHDYRERMGMRNGEDYSDRLDIRSILSATNPGPILNSSGKPLRPFTLLDSRQTVQNGVFKSGHNLPTMTIDEYLEEEKARGGIIEGGGEASGIVPEPEEDNYEKGEEETIKARAWDDFCEENPK